MEFFFKSVTPAQTQLPQEVNPERNSRNQMELSEQQKLQFPRPIWLKLALSLSKWDGVRGLNKKVSTPRRSTEPKRTLPPIHRRGMKIPPRLSGTPQEGNLRFHFDVNVKLWQIENKTNFIAFDID